MNDQKAFAVDLARLRPREKTRARVRSHKQTRPETGTGSTLASLAGEEDGHPAHVPARYTLR